MLFKFLLDSNHQTNDRTVLINRLVRLFPTVCAAGETATQSEGVEIPKPYISDIESHRLYLKYKDRFNFQPAGPTPSDRIKNLWKSIVDGNCPEADVVFETAFLGGMFGFIWGATFGSRDVVQSFIKRHNEMVFEGEYLAKRKLHDVVFISTVKTGAKVGWRMALFMGMFSSGVMTSMAARDDIQPLDFALTGATIGGLWKFKLGPVATLVGAGVTGVLGLTFGCLAWLGLKASGQTVPEWRYWKGMRSAKYFDEEQKSNRAYHQWRFERTPLHKSMHEYEEIQEIKAKQIIEQEQKASQNNTTQNNDTKNTVAS